MSLSTSTRPSGKDIIDTMISAGEKAVRDYVAVSKYPFKDAPEYVLNTYLALSLSRLPQVAVRLEQHVGETQSSAGAMRKGRPSVNERRNGRFDFVIFWGRNKLPRALVEVKSPLGRIEKQRIAPDFERLCKTLSASKTSSLQFCAFAVYLHASGKNSIDAENNLNKFHVRFDEYSKVQANDHDLDAYLKSGTFHVDNNYAWCISFVIFTRNRGAYRFA